MRFWAGDEVKITDSLAPGGSTASVYKFLQKFNHAEEIFCVGHEPDIGKLVPRSCGQDPELDIPFKKAGVLRIDVPDCRLDSRHPEMVHYTENCHAPGEISREQSPATRCDPIDSEHR